MPGTSLSALKLMVQGSGKMAETEASTTFEERAAGSAESGSPGNSVLKDEPAPPGTEEAPLKRPHEENGGSPAAKRQYVGGLFCFTCRQFPDSFQHPRLKRLSGLLSQMRELGT